MLAVLAVAVLAVCSAVTSIGSWKLEHFRRILFAATGALLSPMLIQQGESIPSISHLVEVQGIVSRETT